MNPAYAILCNGTKINMSEVFKMAHRRAKHDIAQGKMKCYVCYYTYDMGKSYPIAVFWYRKDAELWVKEREIVGGAYKEMEIK